MPKTYKELRDDAYRDIFVNTKWHGEQVLVIDNLGYQNEHPVDSGTGNNPWEQAIADAVTAQNYVIGSVSEEQEVDGSFEGQSYDRMEVIVFQCCRDANAMDRDGTTLGGIPEPKLRMGILRSALKDPLQIPYMFVREMEHPSDVLWRLRFERVIAGVRGVEL